MRRLRALTVRLATSAVLFAAAMSPTAAKADITLFDNNGWSFYTNGLIAAHYQLALGKGDPTGLQKAGGKLLTETSTDDVRNRDLSLSRVRSGFIGTQIGFGVNRQVSQNVHIESLLAISLNGIDSNRARNPQKDVDYREAWAAVVSPYGTFKFGRMFSIFGSASAQVVLMAYRFGVGNPCTTNYPGISCGSVGAGPLYAGFDAQMRYHTPRVAGFELQIAVVDPSTGSDLKMTPLPRVDGELNFDKSLGVARVRLIGQGMLNQLGRVNMVGAEQLLVKQNVWGAMGTALIDIGGLSLGGGGWTGKGIGERVPLEANDPANPLAYDKSFNLRLFRGFYGNARFEYHGTAVAAGGGILFVRPTETDKDPANGVSVLDQQWEGHVVLTHQIDAIVLTAEYMRWHSHWYLEEQDPANQKQDVNFMGGGVTYLW